MVIFEADDPRVLNGTYDREGYTPAERRAKERRDMGRPPQGPRRRKTTKPNGRAQAPVVPRTPRQPNLPGTDDRAIRELEEMAQQLRDIRTGLVALHEQETTLKSQLLHMMKAHGKRAYHRKGIAIEVVAENETVKVRVQRPEGESAEAP